ncbi:MAG: YaiI/YqxD family protein [Candidatus Eisenbacteria bacterium]|nr:YaiI/YqxD family protein [Candidatus Eisenbacteria bacterium]MCC7140515.1 YaiI/YqxD family protein [Candidatus Eisenbacteria bacterium]
MLHILVDADACPVKEEILRVAKRYDLAVTLVAGSNMRVPLQAKVDLKVVEPGLDSADDWIVEQIETDDIVVTADIPLAARCLEKGAHALSPGGRPFTLDNIGDTLATRDLLFDLRESRVVTGGPPPFGKADRSRFLSRLDELIVAIRRK